MPRARVNRRGGVGFPHAYRAHLVALREAFAHLPKPQGGVVLRVVVYKRLSPLSRGFGDVDNLLKTVMEALPFDDGLVLEATLRKRRSVLDYLLMEVTYVSAD